MVRDSLSRIRDSDEIRLVLEYREQFAPVLCGVVEHIESTESCQIIRVDLQYMLVGIDSSWDILEFALVDGPLLVVDTFFVFGIIDEIDLFPINIKEFFPTREVEEELDQCINGSEIFWIEIENLL